MHPLFLWRIERMEEKKKTVPRKRSTKKPSARKTPAKRAGQTSRARKKGKAGQGSGGKGFFARLFHCEGGVQPWIIWTVTACVAVAYGVAVYFFFFRPYMQGKQEAELYFLRPQVHGLDISHHQGRIDWERLSLTAYKEHPINFVFMKATEGADFVDNAFRQNFASARECGLIRGAYHFFLPQVSAEQQAENFIRQVQLEAGDLPPVLDVEVVGSGGKAELQQGVRTWLTLVEQHYGVKPVIYASYRFKQQYLSDAFFSAYPYWIAHYYVEALEYKGPWTFWQHTDLGRLEGVNGHVDLDIFNGNLEELMEFTVR